MNQRIEANDLQIALADLLKQYEADIVQEAIQSSIDDTAKNASKKLKQGGSYNDTGRSGYTKGWKVKAEKNSRTGYSARVYNSKAPGLAHLLEFGHATRNGGRTRAFPHISPVNDQVEDELVKRLKEKLESSN